MGAVSEKSEENEGGPNKDSLRLTTPARGRAGHTNIIRKLYEARSDDDDAAAPTTPAGKY